MCKSIKIFFSRNLKKAILPNEKKAFFFFLKKIYLKIIIKSFYLFKATIYLKQLK